MSDLDITQLAPQIIEVLSDDQLGRVDAKTISNAQPEQIEALGDRVTLLPKDVKLVLLEAQNHSLLTQQQKHLLVLQMQETIYPIEVQISDNMPSLKQTTDKLDDELVIQIHIAELSVDAIKALSDEELGQVDAVDISYANPQQIEALGERVTLLPEEVKKMLTNETNRSLLTQQQKRLLGLQVQEIISPIGVQEANHHRPSVIQAVNQEAVHEPRNQDVINDTFIENINGYVQNARDKPYAVFVGMSGNGKTCMLDLLVKTLQGGVGNAETQRQPTAVNTLVPVQINDKGSYLLDTAGENFQAWFEYVTNNDQGNNNNLDIELAFSLLPLKNRGIQSVSPEQNEAFGKLLKNASKLYICTPAKHYNIETNIGTATDFLCRKLKLNSTKPELIFLFNHVDSLIYSRYIDNLPRLSKYFHDYSMKLNNLSQLIQLYLSDQLGEEISYNDFNLTLNNYGFTIDILNESDNKSSLDDYAIVNLDFISGLLKNSNSFDENNEDPLGLEQLKEEEKKFTIGKLKMLITNCGLPEELKPTLLEDLEKSIKESVFYQYKVEQKFIDNISQIYKKNIDNETKKQFEEDYFRNNPDATIDAQEYNNFIETITQDLLKNRGNITNDIDACVLESQELRLNILVGGREISVKYCYLLYLPQHLDHYKLLESNNLGFQNFRAKLANRINNIQTPKDTLCLYQSRFKEIFSLNEFLTIQGQMFGQVTRGSQEITRSVFKCMQFTIQDTIHILITLFLAIIMGVIGYVFAFNYQQIKGNVPQHQIAYMIGIDENKPNPFIALEEKALEELYVYLIERDPQKNSESACMETDNTSDAQKVNSQEKANPQGEAQTHNKENKSTQNKAKCSFNHLVTLHKKNQPWQETEINALLQLLSVSTKIDQVDFKKEQLLLEAWSARKLRGEKARVFALNEHELRLMQDYLPSNIPSGIWHNKQVRNCPPNDIQENRLCDAFRATFTTTGKEFNAIRPIDIKPDNMKSFCSKNMRFCETHKNGLHAFLFGLCIFILGFLFILWKKKNTKSE